MIVISNGFNRFILATAAAQVARAGRLALFLTGAYPTPRVEAAIRRLGLAGMPKMERMLGRKEPLPPHLVTPLWPSELLYSLPVGPARFRDAFRAAGMRAYGAAAARRLPRAARRGALIYHYRAGFGGASVHRARDLGMITLCDHSIVHPAFVESLVRARGRLDLAAAEPPASAYEACILRDLEEADHFLLNSEFVRDTFLRVGCPDDRLDVIYQGIDDGFLRAVPERKRVPGKALRLLAPAFAMRKGAPTLAAALAGLGDIDWELTITRTVEPEAAAAFGAFLADPRVRSINPERAALARLMAEHDVVIFPSYAEGSARVIFEALAAGAYVITTPNAGSVVEDKVHGRLVAAGDEDALRDAVREAAADRDRLSEIGQRNASFVRDHHSEAHYGRALVALYDKLLDSR